MPDLDKDNTPKMTPKKKEVEIDGVTVEVDDIRSVQLNEKISETVYQILHPETDAYQVITDPNRRFVSEEEKAKWNEAYDLGASALHYKGKWEGMKAYHIYDIVYLEGGSKDTNNTYPGAGDGDYGRRFFLNINPAPEAQPGQVGVANAGPTYDKFLSNNWVNINFESYLAEFANNVRITSNPKDTSYTFAISEYGSGDYRVLASADSFVINPVKKTININNGKIILDGSTGTVTAKTFVGDLDGNAKTADLATTAKNYYISDNNTPNIHETIEGINKRIDGITDGTGGAVLSNKLVIQKNGTSLNGEGFDGRAPQTVNITIAPSDVQDLLDDKDKIKEKWLPDTLLGAMTYVGTFNASTGAMVTDLREVGSDNKPRAFQKGDYAIAVIEGNLDPSGKGHVAESPETSYYLVGDWAVYNGDVDGDKVVDSDEWTKVDNTDAVRTVNDQIGNVKTYKGNWTANTQYYAGDMVQYGDPAALYLCVNNSKKATFDINDFKIFGRIYKAADGIELTELDNTFRHSFKDAKDVTKGSASAPLKLKQGDVISVSLVEMNDKYGHISKNNISYYEMPDDTWRPVWVNGSIFKSNSTESGVLDISEDLVSANDPRIDVETSGTDRIIIKHTNAGNGKGSHTSEVLTTPAANPVKIGLGAQFSAPNFSWNVSGHVDTYSPTIFELPTDLIKHQHFNVALDQGRSIIRSFTHDEFTKLAEADRHRRFYDAGTNNTFLYSTSYNQGMAFSGKLVATEFQQISRSAGSLFRVLDESLTILGGNKLFTPGTNPIPIVGQYNANLNSIELGNSGIHDSENSVVYSAVAVNKKGIATAGGQILEFGSYNAETGVSSEPSDALVIGGLFFRDLGPKIDTNGAAV